MARILIAVVLCCVAWAAGADEIPVPKLTAHVVDLTGTLSADERAALDAKLADFEQAKASQVAVLVVPSIGTESIEEFAGRVTDAWQLGRKGVDDGVLFVVAKQERRMRIHTGRGVQGTLTDALSKRIIADVVAPRFRTGDFAGGIDAGVDAIMKAVEGEELPLPAKKAGGKVDVVSSYSSLLPIALFAVLIVGAILRGLFGRLFGAGMTAGVAGAVGWFLLGGLAVAVVAALVAFLITLFMGTGVTRGARSGGFGGFPGGSIGGWSGGGGGGGFGGGGGSFDGGGASRSW